MNAIPEAYHLSTLKEMFSQALKYMYGERYGIEIYQNVPPLESLSLTTSKDDEEE